MPILPNEKKALNALKIELNKRYELLDLKIYGSKTKDIGRAVNKAFDIRQCLVFKMEPYVFL